MGLRSPGPETPAHRYAVLLAARGKARPKDWLLFVLSALFIARFIYLAKG